VKATDKRSKFAYLRQKFPKIS